MATTTAGSQLTARQRVQQQALVASTLKELLTLWPAFNPADVASSWPALKAALRLLVGERRRISASLAGVYYTDFRSTEQVPGSFRPRLATAINREEVDTSLEVTGPIAFKKAISVGQSPDQAKDQALVALSGSITRMVLNGGRDTITEAVVDDDQAIGWVRVTDGDPCYFCAMLASRGPVYLSKSSASFEPHDHDQCGVEPVFDEDTDWPGAARQFEELWEESTERLSGKEAIKAFRRAYEKR